jgi:hypothetical protein
MQVPIRRAAEWAKIARESKAEELWCSYRDLTLWAAHKYKKLRKHLCRASHWLARVRKRTPALFAHWQLSTRHGSAMGAV